MDLVGLMIAAARLMANADDLMTTAVGLLESVAETSWHLLIGLMAIYCWTCGICC